MAGGAERESRLRAEESKSSQDAPLRSYTYSACLLNLIVHIYKKIVP